MLIVAEAGVNHDGCVEQALALVDAAAAAGADAVKFQMFRSEKLATASASTAAYQQSACGESSQRAMLSKLELSKEAFVAIKERCDQRSILFMATPFGLDEVYDVHELGSAAIKIASTDLTNRPLLDAAVACGLPIVLSTGASTEAEIENSVVHLERGRAGNRLILLHCVSCYPAPLESINLRAMASLRGKFGLPVGLSDHTTSMQTGGWAVAAGACILEKHFSLDPTGPGPDHAMSLSPDQLAQYIANARTAQQAMGDGRLGMTQQEQEVRTVAGRSVVTVTAIKAGMVISDGMLSLKRPGLGVPAHELPHLWGRRAAVDIPGDTILSWDMVQ